jgi:formylglycine-generating enzyme required for sulfatase activity
MALLLAGVCPAAETVVLGEGTGTVYLSNVADPGVGLSWVEPWYVPGSGWDAGVFGLGYEQGPAGTGAHGLIATEVRAGTRSIYTRTTFTLSDVGWIDSVGFDAEFDDGIVAWLNGVEIYRSAGMRGSPLEWDTVPYEAHESSNGAEPDWRPLRDVTDPALGALTVGTNVLAVGVWNRDPEDLVLVPRLVLDRPLLRGPYLQQGTAQSVVVRWRTAEAAVSRVWYGTSAGSLAQTADGTVATTEHEVELAGLAPATRYVYAVGTSEGQVLAGGAGELSFETPSTPGVPRPTRVWVVGDSGWGNAAAEAVREAYAGWVGTGHTALWLMLGDNAYPVGTELDYQRNLFEIYAELLSRAVLWPTLGNHDLYTSPQVWPYLSAFTLPAAGEAGGVASGTEKYYAFDWANVHFVVLDSMFSDRSESGPMLSWLAADLASTDQEWIVAFWHHPPYSKGGHDSDTELQLIEMREHALPLLESHGVDLVLTGHSHSYERSMLIDGHYGDTTTFDASLVIDGGDGSPGGDGAYQAAGPGAVYAVAGSGSHLTPGSAVDLGGTGPNHPVMWRSLYELGSMVLEVNGNRLDGWFLDETGAERDAFTLIKGAAPVAPEADFEGSPLTVAAGGTVAFTDLSSNQPTWWGWDFDDDGGLDSPEPSPQHAYAVPGSYTVRLAVSNYAGADAAVRTGYVCVTGGLPEAIEGLRAGPAKPLVSWTPNPLATSYDVLRGDLGELRTHGWSASPESCASSAEPSFSDPQAPGPGVGWYYLVRGVNCVPEAGTFDTDDPQQALPRDPELQGPGAVCGCPAGDDGDGDGYCSGLDNCPGVSNTSLSDADADGAGDDCDVCPFDAVDDADQDGHCADLDNCPLVGNAGQLDFDLDGAGDACDADDDDDGVADPFDWFPLDPLACHDEDGDACDDCTSGANVPADDGPDDDGDGLCNAGDGCTDVDLDGFGTGTGANADCPGSGTDLDDADPTICSDSDYDTCQDCALGPWNPAADGADFDADGSCDAGDNCWTLPNPTQVDLDDDGLGNVCDPCTDTDRDGYGEPGLPGTCPPDNCPYAPNPTQQNSDADPDGDACDSCPFDAPNDPDTDFICTSNDNCPAVPNTLQLDFDGDTVGNACDAAPQDAHVCSDVESDGCDDCGLLQMFAPLQDGPDSDHDGLCNAGDACPLDRFDDPDGDGICTDEDNCPALANPEQHDANLDGIGDGCDHAWIASAGVWVASREVTNSDYAEFLDAVASSDPLALYHPAMGGDPRGGIVRHGTPGAYTYAAKPWMADKPVNFVSWLDAARYANWMHHARPRGLAGPGTTETGAYDLRVGNPGPNAARAPGARWFLPSAAEWEAAAYDDPALAVSWQYPTRSDQPPFAAPSDEQGDAPLAGPDLANYGNGASWNGLEGNVMTVATLGPLSASGYGTYDQGGNVAEWTEAQSEGGTRPVRGGSFADPASLLAAGSQLELHPNEHLTTVGFRLASSPVCADADGDGFGQPGAPACPGGLAADNCPALANPDQSDHDADAVGDACDADDDGDGVSDGADCLPLGPGVAAPPANVGDTLVLDRDGATARLGWQRAFQGPTSNVYTASGRPGAPMPAFACLVAESPVPEAEDAAVLSPGALAFYFVTARNACGESDEGPEGLLPAPCPSLGVDTDGDGMPDVEDGCPTVQESFPADADADFVSDGCDNCPGVFNPDQADGDGDGSGDACPRAGGGLSPNPRPDPIPPAGRW